MKATVYYESWQMDCCGKSFSVGDAVTFTAIKSGTSSGVDYVENHHGSFGDETLRLSGNVAAIEYEYDNPDGNERRRENGDKVDKFIQGKDGNAPLGFIIHLGRVMESKYTDEELSSIYP